MTAISGSIVDRVQAEDDAVSVFLMDCHTTWMQWFEDEIDARYRGTGGSLEILADVLEEGCRDLKCFSLAFVPAFRAGTAFERCAIATKQKKHLRRFLEQLTVTMGLQHPEIAATAAVLVIERTIVTIQLTGNMAETQTARLLLQCLQHG